MSEPPLRVRVWSPLPPSPSGIADYVAELLPVLAERAEVVAVAPDPDTVSAEVRAAVRLATPEDPGPPGLDVYHLGNSPEHAFVYRRAVGHPGVAVLHEWVLHDLVRHVTTGAGDVATYRREMRRSHGEEGSFVARQVARGLGGQVLPALFPLVDRLLERSLGIVALTARVRDLAARRAPGRPVRHVPHHLSLPFAEPPGRDEARARLGLPGHAFLVVAPGLATAAKGLRSALHAIARIRAEAPGIRLLVAGAVEPGLPLEGWAAEAGVADAVSITGRLDLSRFVLHLAAADVVLALRFPSRGEMSGALVRALGLGRPALVTAGSAAADEFPEGVVVPIDPAREVDELAAFLLHLHRRPATRERIGRLARGHARAHHDLSASIDALVAFLSEIQGRRAALEAEIAASAAEEEGLFGFALGEVRTAARELGLVGLNTGAEPLLRELMGGPA